MEDTYTVKLKMLLPSNKIVSITLTGISSEGGILSYNFTPEKPEVGKPEIDLKGEASLFDIYPIAEDAFRAGKYFTTYDFNMWWDAYIDEKMDTLPEIAKTFSLEQVKELCRSAWAAYSGLENYDEGFEEWWVDTMGEETCPNDTDVDGDCHVCARLPQDCTHGKPGGFSQEEGAVSQEIKNHLKGIRDKANLLLEALEKQVKPKTFKDEFVEKPLPKQSKYGNKGMVTVRIVDPMITLRPGGTYECIHHIKLYNYCRECESEVSEITELKP